MIPQWSAVLTMARPWLAPDGELHIVDFGRQERLSAAFRVLLRGWLRQFHVQPRDELEAELERLGLPFRLERPFRGYAQYAVVRRPEDGRANRLPHGPSVAGTSAQPLASHAGRC
jgi:S-adenosylmethionine-diacylgycerolhomoserine-N-methlytransferase